MPHNCWEYWKCSDTAKGQCPVYKAKAGQECWLYTDNLKVFDWAMPKDHFTTCLECPWYRMKHKSG